MSKEFLTFDERVMLRDHFGLRTKKQILEYFKNDFASKDEFLDYLIKSAPKSSWEEAL